MPCFLMTTTVEVPLACIPARICGLTLYWFGSRALRKLWTSQIEIFPPIFTVCVWQLCNQESITCIRRLRAPQLATVFIAAYHFLHFRTKRTFILSPTFCPQMHISSIQRVKVTLKMSTATWMIMLNLLKKWLLGPNLSHYVPYLPLLPAPRMCFNILIFSWS